MGPGGPPCVDTLRSRSGALLGRGLTSLYGGRSEIRRMTHIKGSDVPCLVSGIFCDPAHPQSYSGVEPVAVRTLTPNNSVSSTAVCRGAIILDRQISNHNGTIDLSATTLRGVLEVTSL